MKRIKSVFTDDMEHCYITGNAPVHIHHIFYGPLRSVSERYGYVIPLFYQLHTGSVESVHMKPNKGLDLELKQMAQRHFEQHFGSREDFRKVFGKSWL